MVFLQNGARTAMDDWLEIPGKGSGALLVRIRKDGHLVYSRLMDQAHVKACSPHDIRRSMSSDPLDTGADISTVHKLAGHVNVTTTQRYVRRGETTKAVGRQSASYPIGATGVTSAVSPPSLARAAGLIHIPYNR